MKPSYLSASTLLAALLAMPAWAEPGYNWEMTMQVDGMNLPGMMGGQKMVHCVPSQRPETPGMDEKECKVLESRHSGGHYYWKARCQGNLTTGDFTYLGETAYKGTVTTEERGEKYTMKFSGKRLGKCEYSPPKIVVPVVKQPTLDTKPLCDDALKQLTPSAFYGNAEPLCASRRSEFCARLGGSLTPEQFANVADSLRQEKALAREIKGDASGQMYMTAALKGCKLNYDTMQAKQCQRAAKASDVDFLARYCPSEYKAFCASGRDFTACSQNGEEGMASDEQGKGNSGAVGRGGSSNTPSDGVDQAIGQGINKLKGIFGW